MFQLQRYKISARLPTFSDNFLYRTRVNNEIGEIMSLFDTHGFAVIKGDKGYGLVDKQMKVILDCSYIFRYNRCGPDFAYNYLVVQKKWVLWSNN